MEREGAAGTGTIVVVNVEDDDDEDGASDDEEPNVGIEVSIGMESSLGFKSNFGMLINGGLGSVVSILVGAAKLVPLSLPTLLTFFGLILSFRLNSNISSSESESSESVKFFLFPPLFEVTEAATELVLLLPFNDNSLKQDGIERAGMESPVEA